MQTLGCYNLQIRLNNQQPLTLHLVTNISFVSVVSWIAPWRTVQKWSSPAVSRVLVQPDVFGISLHIWRRQTSYQPNAEHGLCYKVRSRTKLCTDMTKDNYLDVVIHADCFMDLIFRGFLQIHSPLQMLHRDTRSVSALAEPADSLDKVLLPRVALQRDVVAQAPPLDDLRVHRLRYLPLLRHRHHHPAVLDRLVVGPPLDPVLHPADRAGESSLRLHPAQRHGDGVHVPVLGSVHDQPAACKVLCHTHHEQKQLGNIRQT